VLRQALARLRDEGRIYARKGSGTYVTDAMPQARPVAVDTLKNIADIRDFLEFRRFIEGEAAAEAARQHTEEQMHQIRRLPRAAMHWRKTWPSTTRWPRPAAIASSA